MTLSLPIYIICHNPPRVVAPVCRGEIRHNKKFVQGKTRFKFKHRTTIRQELEKSGKLDPFLPRLQHGALMYLLQNYGRGLCCIESQVFSVLTVRGYVVLLGLHLELGHILSSTMLSVILEHSVRFGLHDARFTLKGRVHFTFHHV